MMEEKIWKLAKRAGITIHSYLQSYHFNRSRAFLNSRILWQFNQYVSFRDYQHKFHIVSPSPWPFLTGLSSFIFVIGMVSYMHNIFFSHFTLSLGFFCILLSMYFWFRDIVREGTFMGFHSFKVQSGLRLGFLLFIVSEVMFFFAFFWAYFHFSVCPSIWIGGVWPPEGVVYYPIMQWDLGNDFVCNEVNFISNSYFYFFDFIFGDSGNYSRYDLFNDKMGNCLQNDPIFFLTITDSGILVNPLTIPLLNTVILLSSGLVITFSHNSLRNKDYFNSILSLIITVFLGLLFFFFQIYEYTYSSFSINDGVYGTVFYMLTGFHGFHVLIGTIFLIVCLLRFVLKHFTPNNHFGFEAAIWYWHFVDVVWIFLFFFIYLWPNFSFFYSGVNDIYFDEELISFFIEGPARALADTDFKFFDYSKISFNEIQEVLRNYILKLKSPNN